MKPASAKIAALLAPVILGAQPAVHALPERPSSSNANLGCEINPTTISETGYQLEIYLTNTGNTALHGWAVTLSFSEPPQITGSWNAHVTELSMTAVNGSNVAWNGKLLPGQTTSFGLQGNHDGSFVLPRCSAR